MSGQRAAAEPYTTRFETEVSAVDGRTVWLETSYFFAASGGQPADRGTIGDVSVDEVRVIDGEHVHVLAEEPRFRAGHRVLCSIDWTDRMYCMRAHTVSHVLCGAAERVLEDVAYAGFEIGDETVRVDLETGRAVTDETLVELDRLVNRVVWESRPVSWETVPVAEARERDDVELADARDADEGAFAGGQVRIVTIGDDAGTNGSRGPWNVAACGGTHVRNTREVGPVTVLGRSTPREDVARVELAVGPRAIDRRETEKRATFATTAALEVDVEDVPAEVRRVGDAADALTAELASTRRALLAARLESTSTLERDRGRDGDGDPYGDRWRVAVCPTIPATDLSDALEALLDDPEFVDDVDADVVVAVGQADSSAPVVAVGSLGDRSARAVVDDLLAEVGGTASGTERLAQGSGLDAPLESIVERFG